MQKNQIVFPHSDLAFETQQTPELFHFGFLTSLNKDLSGVFDSLMIVSMS